MPQKEKQKKNSLNTIRSVSSKGASFFMIRKPRCFVMNAFVCASESASRNGRLGHGQL